MTEEHTMLSNKLKKQSIEDMNTKKLAERLKDLGEKSLHKPLLNEALNTEEQISSPENKTRVLAEMAVNLFNSGLEDLGKDIYEKILTSSECIEKDSDRAKTLADLGRTFFDIDKKISEEFFERATGTAGEISDVEERIKSITHIAENKVKIDLIEEGVQLCEDVYEDALNLAEKEQNVLPLINIAEILAEGGHFQQSIDICKKARLLSKDISNENERCWVLGSIGVVYAKSDEIENAVDIAEMICSEEEGNLPVGEIMISLAEADETEKALEFIDCVTNKELVDSILSDIGCKLAKRGRI
ncbi:MAG: tetratricopeptide repeat protein, partial [Thermoplasmatota archaeon]